jgi:hypothetical protein
MLVINKKNTFPKHVVHYLKSYSSYIHFFLLTSMPNAYFLIEMFGYFLLVDPCKNALSTKLNNWLLWNSGLIHDSHWMSPHSDSVARRWGALTDELKLVPFKFIASEVFTTFNLNNTKTNHNTTLQSGLHLKYSFQAEEMVKLSLNQEARQATF